MKNKQRTVIIISTLAVLALIITIKLSSSNKREKYSTEEFKVMMQAKLKDAMEKSIAKRAAKTKPK
jgi:cytochrome c-type biogenesis protein CcmE